MITLNLIIKDAILAKNSKLLSALYEYLVLNNMIKPLKFNKELYKYADNIYTCLDENNNYFYWGSDLIIDSILKLNGYIKYKDIYYKIYDDHIEYIAGYIYEIYKDKVNIISSNYLIGIYKNIDLIKNIHKEISIYVKSN